MAFATKKWYDPVLSENVYALALICFPSSHKVRYHWLRFSLKRLRQHADEIG